MKFTLKYNFAALALIVMLSGCTSMGPKGPKVEYFPVDIISEPLGAKVEVNDNYVGVTPLTINIEGWASTRTFIRSHIIVAHPVRAGGQTQIKSFIGWYEPDRSYGDKIPDLIYFNMSLIRIPKEYDLNIKQK